MPGDVGRSRDEHELVTLADLNHLEAYRELTRRAGGTVVDEDGLTFWAGAHRLPVLVNAVVRTDPTVPAADVLARARTFFARRRRGFTVLLFGARDDDLRPVCEAAEMPLMGDTPGMVLERRLADAPVPAGVTLRVVETDADAAAFARVSGEAYATYGMPSDCAPTVLGRLDVMRAPHIVSVLATLDGDAVAAAMVILTHGIGGVYWVGTRPAARGKGLAELCTRTVGNVAFDRGASFVVLQASQMGEPIYRRMGYREVTRYPHYVQVTPPDA
jgi:ribosomal protein S18 acetylase RimI-like enzyme